RVKWTRARTSAPGSRTCAPKISQTHNEGLCRADAELAARSPAPTPRTVPVRLSRQRCNTEGMTMADESEEFTYEDHSHLPDIFPVFPLPNVVLMPNANLPLFIFEERYKQMVQDCIAGDRYLSAALLKKGWEQESGTPRPFPVAGFGRIVHASRLAND